ncbi:MAG: ribonuclease HII [Candidatus Diapherotrites archaeon]|nr:ribonuclease HII [Candidatus Diapherotrites archaeon]
MIIAGIDEAGRGPVLGPMVMAIALINKENEETLKQLGVKDSKLLTESKRNELIKPLKENLLEFNSVKVHAKEIDEFLARKSLNELEAMHAAKLINSLKELPDLVLVDSPDIIESNFEKRIQKYLNKKIKVISKHKADLNYLIVGAASIIAKVERDTEIKKLSKKFECDLGTGYPHDEKTISFIEKYLKENNCLPECARKSWNTSERLITERFQKKLF